MIFQTVSKLLKECACQRFSSLAIVAGADCGLLKIAFWDQEEGVAFFSLATE